MTYNTQTHTFAVRHFQSSREIRWVSLRISFSSILFAHRVSTIVRNWSTASVIGVRPVRKLSMRKLPNPATLSD
jgi:hypothetical protein